MKKIVAFSLLMASLVLPACGTASTPASGATSTSSSEKVIEDPKARYAKGRSDVLEADQYEYNFDFSASIKYKSASASLPAHFGGVTKWNKTGAHTNYYQKRTASVKLFSEEMAYNTYFYNIDNTYYKVNGDDEKDFSSRNAETITDGYNFEAKSFGVLFKHLEPATINNVVVKNGQYQLAIKGDTQYTAVNGILANLDIAKIADLVGKVTKDKFGVDFNANAYVTFSGNDLNLFHFDISITYSDFTFTMNYDQTYVHVGSGVSIALPTFEGLITDPTEITSEAAIVQQKYLTSNLATSSQYDYTVKTAVDHGSSSTNLLGLAVNSTSAGTTKRTIDNGKIYFDNRLEVDSDYKNKDQYPDVAKDYEMYRANLKNDTNDVYDCVDKVAPLPNVYTKLENYDNLSIDQYYMMPSATYFASKYIGLMKKTTLEAGGYEYKIGLNELGVKGLLADYNKAIRLDPTLAQHIDVFQISDNFSTKKISYLIDFDSSNRLTSINLVIKGFYTMVGGDEVKFGLSVAIATDWTAKTYVIPTTMSEISLF